MTRNDGRALEALVSALEQAYLPDGFKVESNVREYRDGIQLAEFDLRITGRIGTADYCCLIECRDRPLSGPQDAGWVEQVAGRRQRFRASTVIAVSSTGFTSAARHAARELSVELRTLSSLALDDPASWWASASTVTYDHWSFNLDRTSLVVGEDPEHQRVMRETTSSIQMYAPLLVSPHTRQAFSLLQIAEMMYKQQGLLRPDHCEPDGAQHMVPLRVDYPDSPFVVPTCVGDIPVHRIDFDATVSRTKHDLPLSEVREYVPHADAPIGHIASFGPKTLPDGRLIIIDIVRNSETGEMRPQARYV
ncbi:MAG: hypothetical protein JNN30_18220 [Rhodanobacteraceae bacterium]|nr:hypothetical protein [Rhodanobacteraceae bacterium]